MIRTMPIADAPPIDYILPFGDVEAEVGAAPQAGLPPHKVKFKITLQRMCDYGATDGCPACDSANAPGVKHTDECRARFLLALQADGTIKTQQHVEAVEDTLPDFYGPRDTGEEKAEPTEEILPLDDESLSAAVSKALKVSPLQNMRKPASTRLPIEENPHTVAGALSKAKQRAVAEKAKEDRDPATFSARLGAQVPPIIPPAVFKGVPSPKGRNTHGRSMIFDMRDYAADCVLKYCDLAKIQKSSLKQASTPFCPEGSLLAADDDVKGQLSGVACAILMKDLWLGRLARPDLQKPIGDLSSKVTCWTRNDDKKLHRLMCYLNTSVNHALCGFIKDPADKLKLLLFVDADFCGDSENTKSTTGAWLVLAGPNSWFPICWVSKRQTSTSRSTTESEIVALATALFGEAIPFLGFFEFVLGRPVELIILEDNQATITVLNKGYSPKLRHVQRTQKVNIGSVSEVLAEDAINMMYCPTEHQCGDIFTKGLAPHKWANALALLGLCTDINFPETPVDGKLGASVSTQPPDVPAEERPSTPPPGVPSTCAGAQDLQRGFAAALTVVGSSISELREVLPATHCSQLATHTARNICAAARTSSSSTKTQRSSQKLKGFGKLLEVCTSDTSNLGVVAEEYKHVEVIRVTKDQDFTKRSTFKELMHRLESNPGMSMHGSLPCTVWSSWQTMNCHTQGAEFTTKLNVRRRASARLVRRFIQLAEVAIAGGGHVSFEWPRDCTGWMLKPLTDFIIKHNLYTADTDGCAHGMKNKDGQSILKRWRFITTSQRLAASLSAKRCTCVSPHATISGSDTKATESYSVPLCRTILGALFGDYNHTPCMPCCPQQDHSHRSEWTPENFGASPMHTPVSYVADFGACSGAAQVSAAVTKLLERHEMHDQRAIDAIQGGRYRIDC